MAIVEENSFLDAGTTMTRAVEALRSQLMDARVRIVAWDEAARDAQQGNLNQYQAKIDDLNVRMRGDVMDGVLPLEKWMAVASTTGDGIAAVAGYNVTWSSFYSSVVAKTVDDVTEKAKNVGSEIGASAPYYIAAGIAVLVLIFAIKVA